MTEKKQTKSKKSTEGLKKKKATIAVSKELFTFSRPTLPNLRIFYALLVKELRLFFVTPLFYVVTTLFIVSVIIIFFGVFRFLEFGTTDITPLFTASIFSFVFIVPALTMSSIAKERQLGTFEYILTKPFSIASFVIAKWLATTIVIGIISVTIIPIIWYVNSIENIDTGQVIMQLVGLVFTGSVIAALGIAVSSFYKSEIPAYLVTLILTGFLVLSGSELLRILPFQFDEFFTTFGIYSHYRSLARGVLDVRDVLYFVSFASVLLGITSYSLSSQKYPNSFANVTKLQAALIVFIAIFGLITFFGREIPGRIDFTEDKIYTLSDATNNVIDQIDGEVTVTLFTSTNLPVQFQEELRSIEDIIRDYEATSNGKITAEIEYTNQSEQAEDRAREIGLQEILFSVDSQDSSQRTVGFFGMGIEFNDQVEILQLTENVTSNIEFEMTQKIKKLTDSDKAIIGYISNNTARQRLTDYRTLNESLEEIYEIRNFSLTSETIDQISEHDVIMIASPNISFGEDVEQALLNYFNSGGTIFLLTETIEIPDNSFVPVVNDNSLGSLFSDYGVAAEKNIVYDLQSNNQINAEQGIFLVPVDYPLWIRALPTNADSPILADIENVSFLWAGNISVEETDLATVVPLLQTTQFANTQSEDSINISTAQQFDFQESDSVQTIAVQIEDVDSAGRAVVVADATFLADSSTTAQNITFALAGLEWLTGEDSLSEIQAKNRVANPLNLDEDEKDEFLTISIASPLIVTWALGGVVYWIRKKNATRSV